MSATRSAPFDLSTATVALLRDGTSSVEESSPGAPRRVDGLVVGAPVMTRSAPHGGEMHPDGDELLYLLSGRVTAVLEEDGEERVTELEPGQAFVVPRGTWHRVLIREPSQILFVTPGPGGEHRPPRA